VRSHAIGAQLHNTAAPDMLLGAVSIPDDRIKTIAICQS